MRRQGRLGVLESSSSLSLEPDRAPQDAASDRSRWPSSLGLWIVLAAALLLRIPGVDRPLLGHFATKQAMYGMIARNFGRIVNLTSIAGLRPRKNCISYATTKAGLIGFTRSVAEALAP
ncbi:MAG: SDR family oxidoreductase, partial [Planctomycetales bacterium]